MPYQHRVATPLRSNGAACDFAGCLQPQCCRRFHADWVFEHAAVALVYNAERINTLAGRHWQQFARQNYFDGNGVFAGVLLGAPLLTIMFVILVRHMLLRCALLPGGTRNTCALSYIFLMCISMHVGCEVRMCRPGWFVLLTVMLRLSCS
jgi:Transmembrane protein 18